MEKGDTIKFYLGPFCDLIAKIERVDLNNLMLVFLKVMGETKKLKLKKFNENSFNKIQSKH